MVGFQLSLRALAAQLLRRIEETSTVSLFKRVHVAEVPDHSQTGLASIPDASEFLSLSRSKVYQLVQAGDIPCKRFGRSVRIPWEWLKQQACQENGTRQ